MNLKEQPKSSRSSTFKRHIYDKEEVQLEKE